jgi:hypothetical protein
MDPRYHSAIIRMENAEKEIAAGQEMIESLCAQIDSLHSNLAILRKHKAQELDETLKSMLDKAQQEVAEVLSTNERFLQTSHATCIEALVASSEKKIKADCEKRRLDYEDQVALESNRRLRNLRSKFEEEISKHLAKDEAHHEEKLKDIMRQHKRRIDSLEMK